MAPPIPLPTLVPLMVIVAMGALDTQGLLMDTQVLLMDMATVAHHTVTVVPTVQVTEEVPTEPPPTTEATAAIVEE